VPRGPDRAPYRKQRDPDEPPAGDGDPRPSRRPVDLTGRSFSVPAGTAPAPYLRLSA
jgi:hypothetical protein